MKKLFIILIALLISTAKLNAATRSSSKNTRRVITKTTLPQPNELECRENIDYCFNYYCFDKKTLTDGIYSRCGTESASNIVINVNDCLDTRGIIKNLNLKDGCKSYTYTSVVALLSNKDKIENSIKKTTKECREATTALNAAKSCWAKMISHDGSIDPSLRTQLVALCGYSISKDTDMVDRFYNAGNYGDSNIGAQMDMELTGQNTQKRENWRQIVDGVLAGYMEMAELVCGEEDYQITQVNDYTPDSRENLAMVKAKAQADQIGRETANRIVNSWFRKTDCLNSPLPKGGLRWEYIEDGAPDCRIICLDGYEEGATSSECVEKKTQMITFGGFVTSEKAVVGEPERVGIAQQPIPTQTIYSNPFLTPEETTTSTEPQQTNTSTGSSCSKNLPRAYYAKNSKPTTSEICKVFFPNCTRGNIGSRNSYSRQTPNLQKEYFCIGNSVGSYNHWVDLSLMEINQAFGKSFTRFGENYNGNSKSDAGKFLYENCANYCDGSVSTDTYTPQSTPTQTTYTKQTSDCDTINNLNDFIYSSVEYAQEWDAVLSEYNGSCSTKKLKNYVSKILDHEFIDVEGRNEISTLVNIFKNCACKKQTSTTNTSSNSSNYEKQIKKGCEKLVHKGWSIKNNKQKMKYCTETVLPAYCKSTLSSDQLKKCIDTFTLTAGDMPYNCTTKASFNKCVWSRHFKVENWHKSWYSIETSSNGSKFLIFNGYIIHPEDLYYNLPFTDFNEMFP